jgi:hydroxypyruvate isomerase
MNATALRCIGAGLAALGAFILAIRVKKILDSLHIVAKCHEENIRQLMEQLAGSRKPIAHFDNSTEHVKLAQKIGSKLLVVGFLFIFLGNVFTGLSALLPDSK